jgi:hypothetical protein
MRVRGPSLLFLFPVLAFALDQPAKFVSPESLAAELHRIDETIGEGNTSSLALPRDWEVDARGRHYTISTDPLRRLLASPTQARQWLAHLADDLSSSGAQAAPASLRQHLDSIFSRREFVQKPPPGPLEQLWEQFKSWFADLLLRIFGPVFGNPSTGRVLMWILGIGAAAFLVLWAWRWYWRRDAPMQLRLPADVPALEASEWLRAARDAAGRGDFRGAIHASYWAGVTHLQGNRLLPTDFTRTPREYLRCVSRGEASYPPLAGLTSGLERFWYADRPVQPRDFEEALTHLGALGCTPD